MNLNSDSRSSLEELKRRNSPPDVLAVQIESPPARMKPTPTPETHPSAEEWQELLQILWTMGEVLGEQTVLLEELAQRLPTLPNAEQTQTTARETAAIRELLEKEIRKREQAGKQSGRHFSLRWLGIQWAPFRPGWLFLPLGLALLLGLLLCAVRVWSSLNALLS